MVSERKFIMCKMSLCYSRHIFHIVLSAEAVTTGQTLISQTGGEFGTTRLWRG